MRNFIWFFCCFFIVGGVNALAQDTLFFDDFNRTGLSGNLDNGWTEATVTSGDARYWQISPAGGCQNDLRISDQNGCSYSTGTSNTVIVVYQVVDLTGFENNLLTYSYIAEGDIIVENEVATSVYSTDNGANWTPGNTHELTTTLTTTTLALPSNQVVWIGFQMDSDDTGLFPQGTGNRFIVDDVMVTGDTILPPPPVTGTYNFNGGVGGDVTDINNWVLASDYSTALTSVAEFDNAANTFVLEGQEGLLNARSAVTGAVFGSDWTVSNLEIPADCSLDNEGFDLNVSGTLTVAGEFTYRIEDSNPGPGTVGFPIDDLASETLTGHLILESATTDDIHDWDLTQNLDWSATGKITLLGLMNVRTTGTQSLDLSVLEMGGSSSEISLESDGVTFRVADSLTYPGSAVDPLLIAGGVTTSEYILDDVVFSGVWNLGSGTSTVEFEAGTTEIASGASIRWNGHSNVVFNGPHTFDGDGTFALASDLILDATDTITINCDLSKQTSAEDITVVGTSQLTLRQGSANSITVNGNGRLIFTTPGSGNIQVEGTLGIEASGVAILEDGSIVDMSPGVLIVEGGPTAFSQGGALIDLDLTASSFSAGPDSVSVSNNVGWTDWSHYTYWSSPVSGVDISNIPQVASSYQFAPTEEGDSAWSWASGNLIPGMGYALSQAGGDAVAFTGTGATLNSGDIAGPLVGDDIIITTDDDNWTLLGNPYPSAINAEAFVDDNAAITGAIYIWDQTGFEDQWGFTTEEYKVINGTGSSWANGEFLDTIDISNYWIAPFQGFFVEGVDNVAATAADFNNAQRDPGILSPAWEFKSNELKRKLWMGVRKPQGGETVKSTCLIGFIPGATAGWDHRYDATLNPNGLNISTQVALSEERAKSAVIQGLPPFVGDEVVPLTVGLTGAGKYEVFVAANQNLDGQEVWLVDLASGAYQEITDNPYVFHADGQDDQKDFEIWFHEPGVVSVTSNVPTNAKGIYFEAKQWRVDSKGEVVIYDFSGRAVDAFSVTVPGAFDIPKGNWIVEFTNEWGITFREKIIQN